MRECACLRIENETRKTVLCPRASIADTTLTRLFGLLGRPPLALDEGLLIRPSSGVHTWGMTFAIDIVALDRNDVVLGTWAAIGPWRVRGLGFQTRSVLELASGAIDRSATRRGDRLHMEPSGA